jgi:hypothetical protein
VRLLLHGVKMCDTGWPEKLARHPCHTDLVGLEARHVDEAQAVVVRLRISRCKRLVDAPEDHADHAEVQERSQPVSRLHTPRTRIADR